MMSKLIRSVLFLGLMGMFCAGTVVAQTGTIKGTITDENTSEPLIGANVFIQSLNKGSATDTEGKFTISDVPYGTYDMRISYLGYDAKTISVTVDQSTVTVNQTMAPTVSQLEGEVVVTAYGAEKQVNQLTYSAQKVNSDEVKKNGSGNVMDALSGRVSGLKVQSASGIGASTDIVLRGNNSLTGNNQALFVVDGVPYANERFNSSALESGQKGYDYGNTGVDINPDNIASVTVLKGPAAAALYGSRASNGAIVIETKRGAPKQEDVDVTFNTSVGVSKINPKTFPKYQNQYGAGYAESFLSQDIDGDGVDDKVARYTADSSWGPAFDSDILVYQWHSFYKDSPTYHQPTPWTAAENGPITFFETATNFQNSLQINGSFSDNGYYTFGYNQTNKTGVMPNSTLDEYKLNFKGGYPVSDKMQVNVSLNFTQTDGKGRPGRGYNSLLTSFRGWHERNVDFKTLEAAYFRNRQNETWNLSSDKSGPFYFNNPYWTRFENYETDQRKRYVGHAELKYDVADWLSVTGRVAIDNYGQLIEERVNVGSAYLSNYQRRTEDYTEYNFDLLANYNKQLTKSIAIDGVVGANIRRNYIQGITASTNGGLSVPSLYSLDNSVNAITYPQETDSKLGVNGYFASLNLSYNNYLNISLTGRRDKSSSLPESNNVYYYPSASVGFTFSEFIGADWLSLGKIRGSWSQVGKTAPPYSLIDTYNRFSNFGAATQYGLPDRKNNSDLKPENTKAWEVGLQLGFINDRIYLDATYYDQNSINQIIPVNISGATGYTSKFVNAGNIENRGIELQLRGQPVITKDFSWQISANWSKNINTVKALAPGIDFYEFTGLQGGVSIGAEEGGTYGAIRGTKYVYLDGKRVVGDDGNYLETNSTDNVIGTMNPDWRGGVNNEFNYKNFSLSFLVDVRWGGDIFSLDQYYGSGTGVLPKTVGLNNKGNPKRDPVSEGGGILHEGVDENGNPNQTYAEVQWASAYGYRANPHERYVYDGSFVKLRQVGLSYSLPRSLVSKTHVLDSVTISVVGRNLWIIHKNIPYADPEQTIGAGNLSGYQNGTLPSQRNVTFNLELNF